MRPKWNIQNKKHPKSDIQNTIFKTPGHYCLSSSLSPSPSLCLSLSIYLSLYLSLSLSLSLSLPLFHSPSHSYAICIWHAWLMQSLCIATACTDARNYAHFSCPFLFAKALAMRAFIELALAMPMRAFSKLLSSGCLLGSSDATEEAGATAALARHVVASATLRSRLPISSLTRRAWW